MGKYRNSVDGSELESDYEDDEGTEYRNQGLLGSGSFVRARKFQSKDGRRSKAILDPYNKQINDEVWGEVRSKYEFFKALYPEEEIELIQDEQTYRLVLPLFPGKTYKELGSVSNEEEQINRFLSAIYALRDCHNKGYVVVDLKEDNILYDSESGKSYLIDGGIATKEGKRLHPQFKAENEEYAKWIRRQRPFYAPECFGIEKSPKAVKTMDIYSLGSMMKRIFKNPTPELLELINQCQAENPNKRITLDELEKRLLDILFKRTAQEDEVIVDKKDEFFIALGKKGPHSFVMLGVVQNGVPTLLCNIGKQLLNQDIGIPEFALGFVFGQVQAELTQESLHLKGKISYSAYAISYNQYNEFQRLLSLSYREKDIACYQPDRENADTVIMKNKVLPSMDLGQASEEERTIAERSHYINVNNNCRHTGVDLVEYAQGIKHLTDNISRLFFRNLPVSAHFSNGKPEQYFYVFPIPPASEALDPDKKAVLTKIYQRMETLIEMAPYADSTIQKFNALKELYYKQADIPDKDFAGALDAICQWKKEYGNLIGQLRNPNIFKNFFITQTSTQKMVNEIETSLVNR